MDVLVRCDDDESTNVVSSAELEDISEHKQSVLKSGSRVRMLFDGNLYCGTVIATEEEGVAGSENEESVASSDESSDDIPLAALAKRKKLDDSNERKNELSILDVSYKTFEGALQNDDSGKVLESSTIGSCVVCSGEVFAACANCEYFLCYDHFFEENVNCEIRHLKTTSDELLLESINPEDFEVSGILREEERVKTRSKNRKVVAKALRHSGKEHISMASGKVKSAKVMGPKCNGKTCEKFGKSCLVISEESRKKIFDGFYEIGELQAQRDFIARHTAVLDKNSEKTTGNKPSRRAKTLEYRLPFIGGSVTVCKTLFLNTLSISDKMVRTVLSKIDSQSGIMKKDKRGGRQPNLLQADAKKNENIKQHINRFPRVESHYCRATTSKEYLHSDLSLSRMYDMYTNSHSEEDSVSLSLYKRVFYSLNLAFHTPKKDMCSLCASYWSGDENARSKLKEKFEKQIAEKVKVREIKSKCKEEAAVENSESACAVFDLQQVIYLPQSNESAIFYKRRFSVYNFTVYDLATKDGYCYTWNETDSKRGASEIASCVFLYLTQLDKVGKKRVFLFANGCSGQNKNSIMASMLFYFINTSENVAEVVLRFFEPNHGQNEGDSVHSAIGHTIRKAGDVFVPAQLLPIFRLSRKKQPYIVKKMTFSDFLNFKKFGRDIQILSIRDNEINWKDIVELKHVKSDKMKVFFKNSHLSSEFNLSIDLSRKVKSRIPKIGKLNTGSQPVSEEKYNDLRSLCTGVSPVVRDKEFQNFFLSLPHKESKSNPKKEAAKEKKRKTK